MVVQREGPALAAGQASLFPASFKPSLGSSFLLRPSQRKACRTLSGRKHVHGNLRAASSAHIQLFPARGFRQHYLSGQRLFPGGRPLTHSAVVQFLSPRYRDSKAGVSIAGV